MGWQQMLGVSRGVRVVFLATLLLFTLGELTPWASIGAAFAQEQVAKKRRMTLMDWLFGNHEPELAPQPPAAPTPSVKRKTTATAPKPPPKPKIEKSPTATRLAIFGDSLATDLAAGLERFYAEDPNLKVLDQSVGPSSIVRPDYFDWSRAIGDQVAASSFDIAVMLIGSNDRQQIEIGGTTLKPLTEAWVEVYKARLQTFIGAVRGANRSIILVGLPPMLKSAYSSALGQISGIQRSAAFSAGADFVDIYERFVDENGKYSSYGPNLNGTRVRMRKEDGIHFSAEGGDKLAYYLSQAIKAYYGRAGGPTRLFADVLAGTDAALMLRAPLQGVGQSRLFEVVGPVMPLARSAARALVVASSPTTKSFELTEMIEAPMGRADAFGVGVPLATN